MNWIELLQNWLQPSGLSLCCQALARLLLPMPALNSLFSLTPLLLWKSTRVSFRMLCPAVGQRHSKVHRTAIGEQANQACKNARLCGRLAMLDML